MNAVNQLTRPADFLGRNALITGGLGFIGSNLALRLVHFGARVVILDAENPRSGACSFNLAGIEDRVRLVKGDTRDAAIVRGLIPGQDFLFNLAGLTSHTGSMADPHEDLAVNAQAQLTLLEACRDLNPSIRVVYTSTRQVYGRVSRLPVDETVPVNPVDNNGVSKLAGEFYHTLAHRVYGLWTTSLRLTNTFGPRMRVRDAHQNFIGHWIRLLLDGKDLPVFGNGEQTRDLNYVEDVLDALLLCATHPEACGQLYNLGAQPLSLMDLARTMIRVLGTGRCTRVPYPEDRLKIDMKDYAGDYSKIRDGLGWQPSTSLEQGLERTFDYYRRYREHYW